MHSASCTQEIHLIRKLCKSGRFAQAYRRAKRASLVWPDVATFPRYAGIAAMRRKQHDIARAQFKRAWSLAPNQPSFVLNYGLSLLHCNLFEATLELLAQVEEIQGLSSALLHLRALAHFKQENYEKSLLALERALSLDPRHLGSLVLIVDVYKKLGKSDQSSVAANKLNTLRPNWVQTEECPIHSSVSNFGTLQIFDANGLNWQAQS